MSIDTKKALWEAIPSKPIKMSANIPSQHSKSSKIYHNTHRNNHPEIALSPTQQR
jgi:hypothetical protein